MQIIVKCMYMATINWKMMFMYKVLIKYGIVTQ